MNVLAAAERDRRQKLALEIGLSGARTMLLKTARRADEHAEPAIHHPILMALTSIDEALEEVRR